MNMLCVAFLAHYNAINYSRELEESSPARYRVVIVIIVVVVIIIIIIVVFTVIDCCCCCCF